MTQPGLSLRDFTVLVRRAGIALTPPEIETLFSEVAPSCKALHEMSERLRARLTPRSEPAHLFSRVVSDDGR